MKKNLFLLLLVAVVTIGHPERAIAQQEPHYTMFMYNKLLINPGYAGARGVPFVNALYRKQWIGFDGSPQSALAGVNIPFAKRQGAGLTISQRSLGLDRDFYAAGDYSYDLIAQEDLSVRAGIKIGVRSLSTDFSKADPLTPNGDQSLGQKKEADFMANVGAGVYATIAQRYYLGLSVPNINSNNFGFVNNLADKVARQSPHYYLMAGGIFPLSDDINLLPAVLFKYVQNAPFDADLNVNLEIHKRVTPGISYRVGGDGAGDSVDLLCFWQVTDLVGVGAAYDFTLSHLRDYNAGSIEVGLQVDLRKSGKKKNLSNPRFFM